jgi:hypothetical protein
MGSRKAAAAAAHRTHHVHGQLEDKHICRCGSNFSRSSNQDPTPTRITRTAVQQQQYETRKGMQQRQL